MSDSPISFRPDREQRALLEGLQASEGMSASAVLKRGLELMASAKAPDRLPKHALHVEDPAVEAAVEAAASAACDVLDELFKGRGPIETHGIGSNFIGTLTDHLRAMMTGEVSAKYSHHIHLEPLLVRWDSFGRYIEPKGKLQGVTLMRPARKVGEPDTFFNEGRFVELHLVDAGGLFTSGEYAVKDYVRWLASREESPADHPARLVVIDYSGERVRALTGSA